MPNLADSIREPGGPTSLSFAAIPDGAPVVRVGSALIGVQSTDVATDEYEWTTAPWLSITLEDTECDIIIPDESDVVSWPVGALRQVFKINTVNAQVVTLVPGENVSINGKTAGTSVALSGFSSIPDATTAARRILRTSATAYWIF
jgi:hypothetical protein